jgi:hypothetical protein
MTETDLVPESLTVLLIYRPKLIVTKKNSDRVSGASVILKEAY